MDKLGKWFMDVFTSINKGGRLGPPEASRKRVEAFLEEAGIESVFELATLMNAGDPEIVSQLAASKPDLGEWLTGDEPQKALDAYFEERAVYFDPYRKLVTRCLGFKPVCTITTFADNDGSEATADEAWEKVFQILTGRENDDQESSDL
jgi:hypothetical protein